MSADFEKEDWLRRLIDKGFDIEKPAIYIWEGVTYYLDETAVLDTLRKVAGNAGGSVIAFDYLTTEARESGSLFWRYFRMAMRAAHEPPKFYVDSTPPSRERTAELLRSCELFLDEHVLLGEEKARKRAWGGFATAIVE